MLWRMTKPEILQELQEAFPGWCIWRSSIGRLYATRHRRQLTEAERVDGLCQTIEAEDVAGLARFLKDQEQLDTPDLRKAAP